MWILIYFALLSTVSCDGVYRFNRELTESVPELRKIKGEVVYCPDDQTQCGNDQTCCKFPNGIYGCCPLPSAVCCSDQQHCCPRGTTCNLSANTCDSVNNEVVTTLKLKVPSIKTKSICPDGEAQCGNDQTCCKLSNGSYGCCPFTSAVCCSDQQHCCPKGTTCNLSDGTCDSVNSKVVTTIKFKVPSIKTKSIICPDQSQCGDKDTCCQLQDGSYACCPNINAVCCSDKLHCCPQNTVCNLENGTCDGRKITEVSLLKSKIQPVQSMLTVICPGGKYQCKNGFTCCLLDNDDYGCCPYSDAVCCSDKHSCCPNDYKCDLENHKCVKDSKAIISLLKVGPLYSAQVSSKKNRLTVLKMNSAFCPDGQSQCDDGYTCCSNAYGSFGCCVGVNSVCCSDKVHCCPENTICNLTNGTCDSIQIRQMFSIKSETIKTIVKHTSCPDDSPCEEGYTCCPLLDSTYGCCSYTDAVCCSDHSHCCPSGTTCNLNTKTCDNEFFRFIINHPFGRP